MLNDMKTIITNNNKVINCFKLNEKPPFILKMKLNQINRLNSPIKTPKIEKINNVDEVLWLTASETTSNVLPSMGFTKNNLKFAVIDCTRGWNDELVKSSSLVNDALNVEAIMGFEVTKK